MKVKVVISIIIASAIIIGAFIFSHPNNSYVTNLLPKKFQERTLFNGKFEDFKADNIIKIYSILPPASPGEVLTYATQDYNILLGRQSFVEDGGKSSKDARKKSLECLSDSDCKAIVASSQCGGTYDAVNKKIANFIEKEPNKYFRWSGYGAPVSGGCVSPYSEIGVGCITSECQIIYRDKRTGEVGPANSLQPFYGGI